MIPGSFAAEEAQQSFDEGTNRYSCFEPSGK
jgi:hypothetical protein